MGWFFVCRSIDSPAYSLDADQAFSREELRRIQLIWQQVAEDFAPFDVNVTTRFPGDSKMNRRGAQDASYGTRVVISTEPMADCDCDGISYLGAFDDIGSRADRLFQCIDTVPPARHQCFTRTRDYISAGAALEFHESHR